MWIQVCQRGGDWHSFKDDLDPMSFRKAPHESLCLLLVYSDFLIEHMINVAEASTSRLESISVALGMKRRY